MDSGGRFAVAFLLLLLSFATASFSHSVTRVPPRTHRESNFSGALSTREEGDSYCESWKFSIETNGCGEWDHVPARCVRFVKDYMNGERYRSDSEVVAGYTLKYAQTVNLTGDGKDAWVLDVDETLLSNLPYYAEKLGYGAQVYDEKSFDEWVDLAAAPALPASLRLYKELQRLGFKLFLLTGRSEFQRNATAKNLEHVGFTNYERLILRGASDDGTLATVYKSKKRGELTEVGYRLHGCSGDQWSDLLGQAVGQRSFKLPNPMYYIS